MNPIIMVLDKIFDVNFLPGLDKYDFDAAKLNKKIGWGSKSLIGFFWYCNRNYGNTTSRS